MTAKINPPKRLGHLYRVKTAPIEFPVPIVDDDGIETGDYDTVSVVIIKPNRDTMETIERRSAAARARHTLKLDDPNSDEAMALEDDVLTASADELVAAMVFAEMRRKRVSIYYEHRGTEKWAKDDLLIGLETAWVGEKGVPSPEFIYATHAGGYIPIEDDPDADAEQFQAFEEAQVIYAKLLEFETEVAKLVNDEQEAMVNDLSGQPIEDLREKGRAALREMNLDDMYQGERRVQMLFHCTRQANDLSARYFGTTTEVRELDDYVKDRLDNEYMLMEVPTLEGKDSPGKPGSSPTTEPTAADPSTSSGPEGAAA